MKMLNGNICCINLDEVVEKIGRVIVPTKDKSYKKLQVVKLSDASREEGVFEGDILYAPINSGTEVKIDDKDYTIINAREIILILD